MPREIAEADWKVFRQLREVALQRFCQRVLAEVQRLCTDEAKTSHERYLELFQLIEQRDEELALAFNEMRRSAALLQLTAMHSHELLSTEEMERFSTYARQAVAAILEIRRS
jgi:hypothetical protein